MAALWNLLGSIPAIIFPEINLRLFYGLAGADYMTLFLNRGLWWAVLFFGIGYLIIALDPARQWGIIVMGIIGKTVVAVNWFYLFHIGKATWFAVFAASGDSLFTVLFVYYLLAGPRSVRFGEVE